MTCRQGRLLPASLTCASPTRPLRVVPSVEKHSKSTSWVALKQRMTPSVHFSSNASHGSRHATLTQAWGPMADLSLSRRWAYSLPYPDGHTNDGNQIPQAIVSAALHCLPAASHTCVRQITYRNRRLGGQVIPIGKTEEGSWWKATRVFQACCNTSDARLDGMCSIYDPTYASRGYYDSEKRDCSGSSS